MIHDKQQRILKALFRQQNEESARLAKFVQENIFPQLLVCKINLNSQSRKFQKVVPGEMLLELEQASKDLSFVIEDLSKFYYDLYPSLIHRIGIARSTLKLAEQISRKYGKQINIEHNFNQIEPDSLKAKQVDIFKVVTDILNYMAGQVRISNINLDLTYTKAGAMIKIEAFPLMEDNGKYSYTLLTGSFPLDSIQARLSILNAIIDEHTNWANFFKVLIPSH